MNGFVRFVRLAGCMLAANLTQGVGHACLYTLTSNNSSALVDLAGEGMSNWTVDGQDQLFNQSFWYRVGNSTRESRIESVPLINYSQPDPGSALALYGNKQFQIEVSYSLAGGAAGSGSSDIQEQIRVINLTAADLDFHLFQYADFDLGGVAAGDWLQLNQNLSGLYDQALQTKGSLQLKESILAGANHAQAALWPDILDSLRDCYPSTLTDSTGPILGDVTWAFQWDKTIAAGDSFTLDIDKNLSVVPEPAVALLFPAGLAILGWMRRQKRRG